MLNTVVAVTLRLLLLRAGPQDLPYSAALTRWVALLAMLVAFLQSRLTLPALPALSAAVHALASIAVLAGFTQLLLQLRGLQSRAQQTVNALFITGSVMTLLLLPMLALLAPHLVKLAENPDLLPGATLPLLPTLGMVVLSVWNFVVSAHIFRNALDTRPAIGAAAALLAAVITVFAAGAVTGLLAPPKGL